MTYTQENIGLIKKIDGLRTKILSTTDLNIICEILWEVIKVSENITPRKIRNGDGTEYIDIESKQMEIKSLELTIQNINNKTYDNINIIHPQSALTISSLLITLFDASLDEITKIIEGNIQ